MRILLLADEESKVYWDFFNKADFDGIDLIVSCGDLKASYLSFLATMTGLPVLYVRGNHDDSYAQQGPDGCICIEDSVYNYNGIRFMGLGGCNRYKPGKNQFSEKEMKKRYKKMKGQLFWNKGIDVLVTHAPAAGIHDDCDECHKGFEVFNEIIEKYKPKFFVHGHVHMNYGRKFPREDMVGETRVINAYQRYVIEI